MLQIVFDLQLISKNVFTLKYMTHGIQAGIIFVANRTKKWIRI